MADQRLHSLSPRGPQPPQRPRHFWRGAIEAAGIATVFALAGLVWASTEARLAAGERERSPGDYVRTSMTAAERPIWLVDGYNVLHATLLGGRDRSRFWTETRRRELLERAGRFDDPAAEIWVVFDGGRLPSEADSHPHCVFAPSADDWMVDRVRRSDHPDQLTVVTADRQVAARVAHRGASVVSPRDFLARCQTASGDA